MHRRTLAALLFLILGAAQAVRAQAAPFFNVRQFGAAGNGVAVDTNSINKAIDACAAAGGGTVYFPAGTYLSGTVRLKNNVTLWLDSGATLLGSKDLANYGTAVDGQAWYDALILAKNVRHVAIVGAGTIDGARVANPQGEDGIRGPHAVLFYDCQNITVRDVSIEDAGNYSLILRSCQGVNVDGITVHGGADGINMWDTRDATISNCHLYTGDDSLAGRFWENVTVTNCILNSSANGLRVSGHNVLFSNSVIYGPAESQALSSLRHHTEAGFQILPSRAGLSNKYVALGPADNMVLSNITMINVGTPLYVAYSGNAPYSANNLGVGRIIVNNLTALGAGKIPIYVSAPRDDPAKSIILNNVRVTFAGGGDEVQSQGQGFSPFSILQAYGVYARNVKSLELNDVRVGFAQTDLRPALFGEGIGTLDLDRFQPQRATGGAPSIQAAGINRLVLDGREAPTAQVRVTRLQMPGTPVFAGEPFLVTAMVENVGPEGLGQVPLRLGGQTVPRSVWLEAGEMTEISYVNLRYSLPGEVEVQAGGVTKKLKVFPKPNGTAVSTPYHVFKNTTADFRQLDNGFYIHAGGDYPVMEYGDQYGAIFLRRALPSTSTVVVKLENPDLRTNWQGRAGIMVRNDISSPGQSAGYLILGSSPSAGTYLEWDAAGAGLLNKHTEFEGYTLWPHWLKLERRGNNFTGYTSAGGVHWTKIGEATVPATNDMLDVGVFAFCDSARFERLTIQK
jgi:hypothetical protein